MTPPRGEASGGLRIVGLGVALVDVARFESAARRHGERLARRLFTAGERAYAAGRVRGVESLAVRLAAKLAARRALALPRAHWQGIEIVRERGRAPTLRFHGAALAAAQRLGVAHASLTLTHDPALCVGQVVLEGAPEAAAPGVPAGATAARAEESRR